MSASVRFPRAFKTVNYCLTYRRGVLELGDNCTQHFHLGRYIVGYTVRNLVLRRRTSRAVKCDFQTYIRRYTSPNESFEYGYPLSNALLQFDLKLECCKPHKAARHQTKGDVIDVVKLFLTVYRRIYCRKSFDVIQSDIVLQTQVHYNCNYVIVLRLTR